MLIAKFIRAEYYRIFPKCNKPKLILLHITVCGKHQVFLYGVSLLTIITQRVRSVNESRPEPLTSFRAEVLSRMNKSSSCPPHANTAHRVPFLGGPRGNTSAPSSTASHPCSRGLQISPSSTGPLRLVQNLSRAKPVMITPGEEPAASMQTMLPRRIRIVDTNINNW